jgi:penicillin-binding protein 1A
MLEDEIIDQAVFEEALASPPAITPPAERQEFAAAAHFAEEVRRYLFDRLGGERVLNDGLVIETTLDLDLQKAAMAAVRKGLQDHDRRQGYRGPLRQLAESEIFLEIEKLAEENELLAIEEEESVGEEVLAGLLAPVEEIPDEPEIADGQAPEPEADLEDPEPIETGPELPYDQPLLGVVTEVDSRSQTARVSFAPGIEGSVELEDVSWAREPDPQERPRPVKQIAEIFQVGDVTLFVRLEAAEEEKPETDLEAAEQELERPLPRLGLHQEPIVQGSLFSLEQSSGDVLAMVGGYDFEQSQFNRVTQARRQPGSAFKPFIYGAALSRGYTPVNTIYDRPIVYQDPISGFVWRPQNYSRHFYGPVPMRTALVRSVNNATVHLFRDVGVDFVIDYARRLGVQAPLNRDLSLALGSSSVTLAELTAAYAVFANKGRRVVPRFINRVRDRDGNVLLEDVPLGNPPPPVLKPLLAEGEKEPIPAYPDAEILPTDQIISEAAAYLMCDMLMGVVKDPRGTGWRLRRLRRPVGGKTGTTNDQADAWFVGFSPSISTGVWVGHDESRLLGWGETGSRAAAPIWVDFMEAALAGRPVRDFEVPDQIVFQRIDRATGLLADANSEDPYFQPFLEDTAPTQTTGTATSATDARRALREDSF